jgi:hypothetical protein
VQHYHGTPLTPRAKLLELAGRSFCVPFIEPRDLEVCHEIGENIMLDSGAFSAWTRGRTMDWDAYMNWAEPWLDYPTTWAVIPDVIGGTEDENDRLLVKWYARGLSLADGAPVWHLHESLDRLKRLCQGYQRVCFGSSGEYAQLGSPSWHRRMHEAFDAICGNGPVPVWVHMLRGLDLAGSDYPFASADSTNIARNHAGTNSGRAPRSPRAMADEIDARQCPGRWTVKPAQQEFVA